MIAARATLPLILLPLLLSLAEPLAFQPPEGTGVNAWPVGATALIGGAALGATAGAAASLPWGRGFGGSPVPALPLDDRVRLAEAFRVAEELRELVWSGWSAVPPVVLLVGDQHEFLIGHPSPTDDFQLIGSELVFDGAVYALPRQFPRNLLASFPAVGGVPTIVIGRPDQTGHTSTSWVLTLLHEHFHQLQYSQPGYFAGVEALDLADGDQTGMWMLNFPYPYGQPLVEQRFDEMARALASAIAADDGSELAARTTEFDEARAALREEVGERNDRYFAFQAWQEGVARYTELRLARLAASEYEPTADFRSLPDFTPFTEAARTLEMDLLAGLHEPRLRERERVAFYAVGGGIALLLDRVAPGWQARTFTHLFDLDPLFR